MGVLVTILQVGNLALSFVAPSVALALKIKALLELDPDFQVNLRNLTKEAITANDQTIAEINAWRASKGLPPFTLTPIPPLPPEGDKV